MIDVWPLVASVPAPSSSPVEELVPVPKIAAPASSGADTSFTATLPMNGSFCAFVEVKDEQGAAGHATLSFQIADGAPTANITCTTPGRSPQMSQRRAFWGF